MTKFFTSTAFAVSLLATPVVAQDITADTAPVIAPESVAKLTGLSKEALIFGGGAVIATAAVIAIAASDSSSSTGTN